MIKIRLARGGTVKRPFYHVMVADSRKACRGRSIERVGYFNPIAQGQEKKLVINLERLNYWVSKGAQLSERVSALVKEIGTPESCAV